MITFSEFYNNILTEEFIVENSLKRLEDIALDISDEPEEEKTTIQELIWGDIIEKLNKISNTLKDEDKEVFDKIEKLYSQNNATITSKNVLFLRKSNLSSYESYLERYNNMMPCLMVLIEKNETFKDVDYTKYDKETLKQILKSKFNLLYYYVDELEEDEEIENEDKDDNEKDKETKKLNKKVKTSEDEKFKYILINTSGSDNSIYDQSKKNVYTLRKSIDGNNNILQYFKNPNNNTFLKKLFLNNNAMGAIIFPHQKNKALITKIQRLLKIKK